MTANLLFQYDDDDGIDLTESVVDIQDSAPMRLNAQEGPKRHGVILSEVPVMDARRISIRGVVQEDTATILRDTLDNIQKVLHRPGKKLRIYDDRYYTAYLADFAYALIPGSAGRSIAYTASFICPDPFCYNDDPGTDGPRTIDTNDAIIDITNGLYGETFVADNEGSAYTYPVYTFVATGSVNRIVITNNTTGKSFTYTGTIAAGKTLIVDCPQFKVTNDGVEDLNNWSGSFVWLDPGENSISISGKVIFTAAMEWTVRSY